MPAPAAPVWRAYRRGMAAGTAESARVTRASGFAIVALLALAGCKDPPGASAPATALVGAGTGIVVNDVRTYAASDAVAGSNDEYYIVAFTFTNGLGFALAPRIDHFVIEDDQKRRFLGAESGNANLVGISNYRGTLRVGDAHDYTVGFRVPHDTRGLLFYDATF